MLFRISRNLLAVTVYAAFSAAVPCYGATDSITITEMSGAAQTNYPVQIGRPFVDGEISTCPRAVVAGVPVTTQANVLSRYADGSVKHAAIAFLVPSLAANSSVTVTFQNQVSCNTSPLSKGQMLAPEYNFDAQINLAAGDTQSFNARTVLNSWDGASSNYTGPVWAWTPGQVANTIVIADHLNGSYDMGWKDKAFTAITNDMQPGDASVTVADAKDISALQLPTVIQITEPYNTVEQMCVTSVSGNILNFGTGCSGKGPANGRGWNATVAAAHSWPMGIQAQGYPSPAWKDAPLGEKPFRPIVQATFWPTINKVRVRFIGEIANVNAMADQLYNVALATGQSNPVTCYSQNSVAQHAASRWTKECWIGGAPSQIKIDHNLPYLASTKIMWNYDSAGYPLPATDITEAYSKWMGYSDHASLMGVAALTPSGSMPGDTLQFGPTTWWNAQYLFTFDPRAEQVAKESAALAGSFPWHYRESVPNKTLNWGDSPGSAVGHIWSVVSRPTTSAVGSGSINGSNFGWRYTYTANNDRVRQVGNATHGVKGWEDDIGHLVDFNMPIYIVTADFYWLEEAWFEVSGQAHQPNGARQTLPGGRGPAGAGGNTDSFSYPGNDAYGGSRYAEWDIARRAMADWLTPDGVPEKTYIDRILKDDLAIWDGAFNLTSSPFHTDPVEAPNWQWGHDTLYSHWNGISPLGIFAWGWAASSCSGSDLQTTKMKDCESPWMLEYGDIAWGMATLLGYSDGEFLANIGKFPIGILTTPGYNPYLIAAYDVPTSADGSTWIQSWASTLSYYTPSLQTANTLTYDSNLYPRIAVAGVSFLQGISVPGAGTGAQAYSWLKTHELNADGFVLGTGGDYNDAGFGRVDPRWTLAPASLSVSTSYAPNACDLNSDGAVNQADVQLAVDQVIHMLPCSPAGIQRNGTCTVMDVQRIVNASAGASCVVKP